MVNFIVFCLDTAHLRHQQKVRRWWEKEVRIYILRLSLCLGTMVLAVPASHYNQHSLLIDNPMAPAW